MNLLRDNGSLADSKTDKPSSHSFIEGNPKSSGGFMENASSSSPFRYSFPECIMVAVDHFDLYARIILEARQQPSLLAVPHVHAEQTHAHQLGIRLANRTDIGNARIPQPTLFVQITEKDPARRRQLDALLATDEKLRA